MSIWSAFSKKLRQRIEHPKNVGFFTQDEARAKMLRHVVATAGSLKQGQMLSFYWLVDESDGVIADAKFQVFGDCALIGAADAACDLVLRKNYEQARRITADLIDKSLQDKEEKKAFPESSAAQLNLVIDALEEASNLCMDIPISDLYTTPPIAADWQSAQQMQYPGWKELSKEEKISVIREVIEKEVQPYVALDAGGVEVLDLLHDQQVLIGYQGSCTTCYSATGSTLHAIEQILRAKVFEEITVVPDMSFLQQS